ncbi:MAG TPA: 2-oxo acid dehydrogenase subunit E2 [Spirochaetaceae bacterium]|nr:2-oxo acid dehydrogenase subunit E2 [Spirochaetaceae bacterium]
MAKLVPMPRQGNTVESCVLVGWRLQEGAAVKAQDILCDVETDKAVFEVAAGFDGTLLKLLVAEGDDVPVLQPIAVIGEAGEDWQVGANSGGVSSAATAAGGPSPDAQAAPSMSAPAPEAHRPQAAQAGAASAGVSPRARALAAKEAIRTDELAGSGPGGRVIERDIRAAIETRGPLSAAARSAAAQAGATLSPALEGSGPGGRIRLTDLEAAARPARNAAPALGAAAALSDDYLDTPIKGIRKLIAERMRDSLATTAQYTLHASAPAERLQALRARMKAAPEALGMNGVTVGDIVLYLVSRVLKDYPNCNALKLGDTLRSYARVHLGLAVDTPRGLMVPVIRNADLLSLSQISDEAKRLAAACVEGKAQPDELSGSTFTVSNLGSLGVDYFTPVINAPEVCVLGVGAILPKAITKADGSYELAPAIGLSLSSDHQVVDGAPAARFLKALCAAVADADLWISK